ncbi:MAG: AAA family ATPase [Pseudomonadota bacterium]
MNIDPIRQQVEEAEDKIRLKAVTLGDFLTMKLPERELLMAPWLPSSGLVMIYAPRGIGKTWLAVAVTLACASGGELMGWPADKPRRVLYLDGEMPGRDLQERFACVANSSERDSLPDAVTILTPDLQPRGMPDLSTPEGQAAIEHFADDAELIVVDNIATLCRSGKENEGESWIGVQEWALRMRAQGKSVLFIHHAGKGGQQRGTSRREDVLDTVIALKYPKGEEDAEGARFELHFEKHRGFYGEDARPREVNMVTAPDGRITWQSQTLTHSTFQRVVEMLNEGLSAGEAARELSINKSTAHRHQKRAEGEGLYTAPPKKKPKEDAKS